jgi:hypothetical protein
MEIRYRGCAPQLLFTVALIVSIATTARATDVTECGTTVATGDTAVLQADLDCSSYSYGIRLLRDTTLELNGHSIAGGDPTFATVLGVSFANDEDPPEGGRGRFTIHGPGEISGKQNSPIISVGTQGCVVIQNGRAEISSPTGVVDIHDCVWGVVGYLPEYSNSRARATLDHVVLHDNAQEGVTVNVLVASNVESYANDGFGIHAISKLVANDVYSHDNVVGVFATRSVKGSNITATANGNGVASFGSIELTGLVATDNTYLWGVQGKRVKLIDSTVTGSPYADIRSDKLPELTNTVCGTSYRNDTGGSWGVCTDD